MTRAGLSRADGAPGASSASDEPRFHPALAAWARLGYRTSPSRVEVLKGGEHGRAVYRLERAGPDGSAVIAKRRACGPKFVAERAIYERVSRAVPIEPLRYYGAVVEDAQPFGWVFVEATDWGQYSPHEQTHRIAAGRWLGILHTQAPHVDGASALPEREPYSPSAFIADARTPVLDALSNPHLAGRVESLQTILSLIRTVEHRLGYIEELCERAPRTTVHGDFVARNLRAGGDTRHMELVSLDWEDAGWGCPLIDLLQSPTSAGVSWASADVREYASVVQEHWPGVTEETVQAWAHCATVLRCLRVIGWDAPELRSGWPHKALSKIDVYATRLTAALDAAGWVRL